MSALTVFSLPVQVGVVSDGDLPGGGVQLQALHHGLVSHDPGVDHAAPIAIVSSHLETET